jgi:hypothetical protein
VPLTPHVLAPNDLIYKLADGTVCYDCRMLRLVAPNAGTLHVEITWSPSATLSLFVGGQMTTGIVNQLSADVVVNSPGEVIAYLGVLAADMHRDHTKFTIQTSMQ